MPFDYYRAEVRDMTVLSAEGVEFDFEIPVVVVGAGACGLVAALAAHDEGQQVLILERTKIPAVLRLFPQASSGLPARNCRRTPASKTARNCLRETRC